MLAAVITVSDRAAAGSRPDASGPVAAEALLAAGWEVKAVVVADGEAAVGTAIDAALAAGARLVVTSGGTGVGPRDRTPEGTAPRLVVPLPGIMEELRRRSVAAAPGALLSRGLAGVAESAAGRALVVNLPGSPGGVRDGIELVLAVAAHAVEQFDGSDH